MKKAMLSQPMGGKTDEEIVETRERAIKVLEAKGYEVVNTLFTDEYIFVKKVEERRERHEEKITEKDSKGKEHTRIRVYYEWETENVESLHAKEIKFCGSTFSYNKIDLPSSKYIKTIPGDISLGSETAYKLEYDDLYSTPVGTQLDKIKNVKVARYLYSKSNVEDDLTSETLVYDGNNAIYYMTDACYGYKAIIEEAKSGQSIEIKSSGAYYVELAISGVSVGEEIKIAVKGYKYNVSTAYTVQTINNRGTDKEWQNPLISNAEHGKLVTAWLADYFASGIQYELDYRGEPAIDCGDTIGQENKYDPDLKTIVEESQITFSAGLLGGGLITRRKECVART